MGVMRLRDGIPQFVHRLGWLPIVTAVLIAVSLHVFAAMRQISPSAEILVGGWFGPALALHLSFALAGASAFMLLLRMLFLMPIAMLADWRRRPVWPVALFIVNTLEILAYLYIATGLYIGFASVGMFLKAIPDRLFPLVIALPILGLLMLATHFIPTLREWRKRKKQEYTSVGQPEFEGAVAGVAIVILALVLGQARGDFMLDHNPVIEVSMVQENGAPKPMRLILSAGGWTMLLDGDCQRHYVPHEAVDHITDAPADIKRDFRSCSERIEDPPA